MTLTTQAVRVETGTDDEDGLLVFAEGRLVAVLVRLSDQHETAAGQWFYECGFGSLDGPDHPVFSDLDAARSWIDRRCDAVRQGRTAPQRRDAISALGSALRRPPLPGAPSSRPRTRP